MLPKDKKLYNKTKKYIYNKYKKHSAYRSGLLVKKHKEDYKKKHGSAANAYYGKKTKKKGLSRWFLEKWKNQRGETGYRYKNDIYRPTVRVTRKTPKIFRELSKKRIKSARLEKYKKGRILRF